MGIYSQNSLSSPQISQIDMRRRSVDSIDEVIRDGRGSIDYGRDSIIDQSDIAEILKRRKLSKAGRVRKRLDTLLHTHIALILVTVLSSLDAVCVIGQVICDILIMSDKLSKYDDLHDRAIPLMFNLLPEYLNTSMHGSYDFEKIVDHLEEEYTKHGTENATHDAHTNDHHRYLGRVLLSIAEDGLGALHHRVRRASGGSDPHAEEHEEHDLLHELTHSFHIGSMVILSVLLVETFFKIFAMWKHFLDHKLEIFDAFVIIVSWCLDVAFWEGIWARPGQEGATLLIFILPWRVIRIVNSFVLVIQEKDLVLLKLVKQRLRISLRKEKEYSAKLDKYRLEVKNLQGLCRKCGADENAILACCPAGRRRRSSLFQSLTSLASVALVSAMGSSPKLDSEDSDDDTGKEEKNPKSLSRIDSRESGINVKFDLSPDNDSTNGESAHSNKAFRYDDETISKYNGKPPSEGYQTRL